MRGECSYIVAFDEDVETELKKEQSKLRGNYRRILGDIHDSEITYEEAMYIFEEDIRNVVITDIADSIGREQGSSAYADFLANYNNNEEYIEMIDRLTGKYENDFSKKIMDKAYIAVVSYADPEMEQIMPNLKCVMYALSVGRNF